MALIRSRQRIILLFAALPVLLTTVASLYRSAMWRLEGQERSFWDALEWAAETITTTGYGSDAHWEHPMMILFVISLQFVGVFLVYMLVPLFLLPLIEERLARRVPTKVASRTRDHVVLFRYGPAVETLLEELVTARLSPVVAELDEEVARELIEAEKPRQGRRRRIQVVHERNLGALLGAVELGKARALVLNGSDEENAAAALVAQELDFSGEILALADEPFHRQPLYAAGATTVFTPRHVLGAALAARASHRIQPRIDGIHRLGKNVMVEEIPVDPESELVGRTLAEADLGARTGATVLGQWVRGKIDAKPTAETRIEPRGLLLAIGRLEAIDRLTELAAGRELGRRGGPLIVAGYGEVGRKVTQLLREVEEEVLVIDKAGKEVADGGEIDVVGDIADPLLLDRLDLDQARGIVLALDSDRAALFATLILYGESPDLPIIARVNRAENLDRFYRAGADFVLSVSRVSAQILARRLLREGTLALDTELQLLAVRADEYSDLLGQHPSDLAIREQTGCSVVGVERDDDLVTRFPETFRFQPGDAIYVAGHRSDTERFAERYGPDPEAGAD